jgi:thymidylate synthase (FAD)
MRVHDAPLVVLVARPQLVWTSGGDSPDPAVGVYRLLEEYGLTVDGWRRDDAATDGDLLPELMGRLCYGSFGEAQGRVGSEAYIGNIVAQGHGSVLEHATWSFVACRSSRACSLQQVRHRAGFAYSGESTHFIRYGDGGRKGEVEPAVCVTGLEGGLREEAAHGLSVAVEAYSRLWDALKASDPDLKKKEVSGAARGLLPNALEARLGFSGNARALRHLCEYRANPGNTLEIRLLACQVLRIMKAEAPASFRDLVAYRDEDGWPSVGSTLPPPESKTVVTESGESVVVTARGPKV